jgi:hypothetical protein
VQDRSRRIEYAQRSSGIRRPERITAGLGQIARTLAASGQMLRFSERPEPPIIRLRFIAPLSVPLATIRVSPMSSSLLLRKRKRHIELLGTGPGHWEAGPRC